MKDYLKIIVVSAVLYYLLLFGIGYLFHSIFDISLIKVMVIIVATAFLKEVGMGIIKQGFAFVMGLYFKSKMKALKKRS